MLKNKVKWGELYLEDDLQGSNRVRTNKRFITVLFLNNQQKSFVYIFVS